MKILAKVIHGSYLYGLNGPNSDKDFKAIHLPPFEDCLYLQACKNTNSKDEVNDIENESFALQRFLQLASNSESIVIDMLHSSDEHILETSKIWDELRFNKYKFYTKKMVGSLGYAKNMALKYGYRADRMEAAKNVYDYLRTAFQEGASRLYQCWDNLPFGEYIYKYTDERNNNVDNRVYEVASKKLQATIRMEYAIEIIEKLVHSYGQRVQAANAMGGTDWKAISHSFRVGYQLYHIYKNDGFIYPLPESEFLKDVKYGKLNYIDDKIDQKLNDLITEVEQLSIASNYPNKVDQEWIKSIILEAYGFKPLEWRS
jgi:predicted nucleotidyltransferase